jgi:NADPH-dependent 2,4-dienoyl-CoA reductase/sulfur reductase-like enzyme
VIADIRSKTNDKFVVGMRISGGEMDQEGLTPDEALEVIVGLEPSIDYVSVVGGTSASIGGAVHIVPPMSFSNGYMAPFTARVKSRVRIPVFLAGRINRPQDADALIASGQADVCGMTRALICDPEMPKKAQEGRDEDIRACIACNQACIGHFHKGQPISCIQHPVTGRELKFGRLEPASKPKKIMVVGGGPAGMKAAVVASQRGHRVTLYEASGRLGGQVLLAQLVPDRSEFGGLVANLTRELELAQVDIRKNIKVDRALVEREGPDVVVIATGALPFAPDFVRDGNLQVVDAWDVLTGKAEVGNSVVVIDWRCDWTGIGMAIRFARAGCRVHLAANGTMPGESIPLYVRDQSNATLQELGVTVLPYTRLYGCDDHTVYLQQTVSGKPIEVEGVETLVLCTGHIAQTELSDSLADFGVEQKIVGDSLAPRTAEEAIYEGFEVGATI